MSKGYKKEYLTKVKTKFDDLQPNRFGNSRDIGGKRNDKLGPICQPGRVDKPRRNA